MKVRPAFRTHICKRYLLGLCAVLTLACSAAHHAPTARQNHTKAFQVKAEEAKAEGLFSDWNIFFPKTQQTNPSCTLFDPTSLVHSRLAKELFWAILDLVDHRKLVEKSDCDQTPAPRSPDVFLYEADESGAPLLHGGAIKLSYNGSSRSGGPRMITTLSKLPPELYFVGFDIAVLTGKADTERAPPVPAKLLMADFAESERLALPSHLSGLLANEGSTVAGPDTRTTLQSKFDKSTEELTKGAPENQSVPLCLSFREIKYGQITFFNERSQPSETRIVADEIVTEFLTRAGLRIDP